MSDTEERDDKQTPEKKDPSLIPVLWDPFNKGLSRGLPGVDAEFDISTNPDPWQQEPAQKYEP